jgi:hypothetical protein
MSIAIDYAETNFIGQHSDQNKLAFTNYKKQFELFSFLLSRPVC